MAVVTKGRVIENSAAVLLARITNADGTDVEQADVSALVLRSYDKEAGTLITPTGGGGGYTGTALDPADVVFDTLQTGDLWTVDDTGYNLAVTLNGSYWPEDKTYQIELKVTPTSGDVYYVLWELRAYNIFSE